jgi:hypothetical protein
MKGYFSKLCRIDEEIEEKLEQRSAGGAGRFTRRLDEAVGSACRERSIHRASL